MRGGHVGHMETALIDTAFSVVPYQAIDAKTTGNRPPKAGSGNPVAAPYQCFGAADGELMIAAPSQRLWEKLVHALDAPYLLSDARFESVGARTRNLKDLEAALNNELGKCSTAHWIAVLTQAGIPAAEVSGLEQSVVGEIAAERATFQEAGGMPLVRLPWMIDGDTVPWKRPAPTLGEHTGEVLREIGYSDARIEELTATGGAAATKQ